MENRSIFYKSYFIKIIYNDTQIYNHFYRKENDYMYYEIYDKNDYIKYRFDAKSEGYFGNKEYAVNHAALVINKMVTEELAESDSTPLGYYEFDDHTDYDEYRQQAMEEEEG